MTNYSEFMEAIDDMVNIAKEKGATISKIRTNPTFDVVINYLLALEFGPTVGEIASIKGYPVELSVDSKGLELLDTEGNVVASCE